MLLRQVNAKKPYTEGLLKQVFIYNQMPQKADFQLERTLVYQTIVNQIATVDPNTLLICGVDYIFFLQRFKLLYGLRAEQVRVFISLFINLLFGKVQISMQMRSYIIKVLTYLLELAIQIPELNIDNNLILKHYEELTLTNHLYQSKNFESYVSQLSYLTLLLSKHGNDIMKEVFDFAVFKRQIRYIALFIGCLKLQENAQMLLKQLFEFNGYWDQDLNWFHIISMIVKRFPNLDYVRYFPTIFQNVIKMVSETLNANENDESRLFGEETIGVPSLNRSIPQLMVNLIVPSSKPHCNQVWMYIQRLFNMILSPLGSVNNPIGCVVLADFLKNFFKSFSKRANKQRQQWEYTFNEDSANNEPHEINPQDHQNIMDDYCYTRFDKISKWVISKYMCVEAQSGSIETMMSILVTFNKQYHTLVLQEIQNVLNKDEEYSIITSISTLGNILEYSIVTHPQKIDSIIDIARRILEIIDRLGINDNVHLLQVILRMFIYFPKDNPSIDSMKQQILDLIITNIDTLSTVFANQREEQSELYIDLNNLFNPLFFSLDKDQLQKFKERVVFHMLNGVHQHTQAYQRLIMIYSYIDPSFPDLVAKKIFNQVLKQVPSPALHFFEESKYSLQIENKQSLRWYTTILECTFQYQPQSILKHWNKLDQIIICMMKNSNKDIFECGYSLMFNLMVSLIQKQLPVEEFRHPRNYNYDTLSLNWVNPSKESLELVESIVNKYVYNLIKFVEERYKEKMDHKYQYTELIDGILVQLSGNQHVSEERKLLQKILLIMQSVVSALLPHLKVQNHPQALKWQDLRKQDLLEKCPTLSDDVIRFLQKIINLSNTFGFLSDPEYSKVYYAFYSDMHGNIYTSDMLNPAQVLLDKLKSWSVSRSLNVLTSQYLLIGQVLFNYYLRIDFLTSILPYSKMYPICTWNLMVLDHHQSLKIQDRMVDPAGEDIFHMKHKQTLKIWLQKLDINNPNSYLRKISDSSMNKNKKQRYEKAITELVLMFKKISQYLNLRCCVQDNDIREMLFELCKVYHHLQKKKDRIILLDHLFNIFTVQFQNNLILREKDDTFYQRMTKQNRVCKIESPLSKQVIKQYQDAVFSKINYEQYNSLAIQSMKKIIIECIQILKTHKQQKHLALISLLMLLYSRFIASDDPLLSQIFSVLQNISKSAVLQIFQMGNMGVFHLINRTQRANLKFYKVDNITKKTNYDIFLVERNFNIPKSYPVETTFCQKYNYIFFKYPYIDGAQEIALTSKENLTPLQSSIIQFLSDENRLRDYFENCLKDGEFTKSQEQTSHKVIQNSQSILNFIFDRDPLKTNIFTEFAQSYEVYATNFYYRVVKKLAQLGGQLGVSTLQKIAQYFRSKSQDQYQLMYCHLASGILKRQKNQKFISDYIQTLATCTNQIFITHQSCLFQIFKQNPFTTKEIYSKIVQRLREEKGSSRLRHIQIWKIFVLNQGRWARQQSVDAIRYLLREGITQSSAETAEAIVSSIVQCFAVPINLHIMPQKIDQPISNLIKQKKLFKVSDRVGFQMNALLNQILELIKNKIKQQKGIQSEGLRIHTNMATKIFDNLLVYQFNDYFYSMLEGIIRHQIEKSIEDANQIEMLKRLGESQYPYHIYKKLKQELEDLNNRTPIIVRKKLKVLEALMFNRGYSTNEVEIPNIFSDINNLTINHIIAASNIFKALTPDQLQTKVEETMKMSSEQKYPLLMSFLMSSGNWLYQWKEATLKIIVGWRMKKLVKEFVSYWWKGKGEGLQGQQTLAMLVRNVGNPYNYLA